MASYGHQQVTTPNFDRLRMEGLSTRAMLAGGSRTTEGMFATFCSAQNPLGQTVAQSQLQNYNYDCLPELLRGSGLHTAFFQGSNKETSGTGSFAQLLGFEESFGKRDIQQGSPQLEQNSWGYHDPDIYRFALDKMRRMPQPFLIGINTNSTHDNQLPAGVPPLLTGNSRADLYQNVLHFADEALDEFIAAVRATPELAETIFVLVADHSGLTPPQPLQKHLIPFAILAPDRTPLMQDVIASQRDIAPTLLQMLNIPIPRHFSGNSLLNTPPQPRYADYYHQGVLGWVEADQAIEFPINARERITCLSLEQGLGSDNTVPCQQTATAMQHRALAFTHISQSLLFSGKLAEFAALR
jgi:phosphoglycerol transferase MdoB-like AlkP superfamily enzyme